MDLTHKMRSLQARLMSHRDEFETFAREFEEQTAELARLRAECERLERGIGIAEMMRDQTQRYHEGATAAFRAAGIDLADPIPEGKTAGVVAIERLARERDEAREDRDTLARECGAGRDVRDQWNAAYADPRYQKLLMHYALSAGLIIDQDEYDEARSATDASGALGRAGA